MTCTIDDLPLELHSDVTSTMFADDTTILVRGPSVTSLSTQLNEVARTVSTWADNNRMSLNTTKTKSLLITTLQKRRTLTSSALNVQIDGRSIEQVDYAKMLGVMIDSDIGSIISIQSVASLAVVFIFSVASNLILTLILL